MWPRRVTLVADDDEVVGFADVRPTRDDGQDPAQVGEVASFYVLLTAWGRGIGRQVIAAATSLLAGAGYMTATLWVLNTNTRAIRFYKHAGWSPDAVVKEDVVGGATIHDLRYRRQLS